MLKSLKNFVTIQDALKKYIRADSSDLPSFCIHGKIL